MEQGERGGGGRTENRREAMGAGKLLAGRSVARDFAIEIAFFGIAAVIQLGDRIGKSNLLRQNGCGSDQKDERVKQAFHRRVAKGLVVGRRASRMSKGLVVERVVEEG